MSPRESVGANPWRHRLGRRRRSSARPARTARSARPGGGWRRSSWSSNARTARAARRRRPRGARPYRRTILADSPVSSRKTKRSGSTNGCARPPDRAPRRHVGPSLLVGAQGLLNVRPRRSSTVHSAPVLRSTPCSASSRARSAARVRSPWGLVGPRQLARLVPAPPAGLRQPGPPPAGSGLADEGHAHLEHGVGSAGRHAAVHRRQNPRARVRRIASAPAASPSPPPRRRAGGQRIRLRRTGKSPVSSGQCENALR